MKEVLIAFVAAVALCASVPVLMISSARSEEAPQPGVHMLPVQCIEASGIPASAHETVVFNGTVRWSKFKEPNGHVVFGFWLPGGGVMCMVDQTQETPEI